MGEAGSCPASHLGWGGDFDLPPPSSLVFSSAQNTVQNCPTPVLPPEAHTRSFSFVLLTCPGSGSRKADVSPAGGEQEHLEGVGAGSSQRLQQQHRGWEHTLPGWTDLALALLAGEFGAGDHTPLDLSFLFTVLVW